MQFYSRLQLISYQDNIYGKYENKSKSTIIAHWFAPFFPFEQNIVDTTGGRPRPYNKSLRSMELGKLEV